MTVLCIICQHPVAFADATAGSLYADGSQAFACNAHLLERGGVWTFAWIDFDAEQRRLLAEAQGSNA